MAERAWTVRARHARRRRSTVRGLGTATLPRVSLRLSPRWADAIQSLSLRLPARPETRSRRIALAAHTARALLDGIPLPVPDALPGASAAPRAAFRRVALARLPLRYAAHAVILLLVLTIAIGSGASAGAGVLQFADAPPAQPAPVASLDAQVRPLPAPAARQADSAPALPAVRSIQEIVQPTFVERHQLAEGETLGAIAERYHVSVASLFWSNGLDQNDVLAAGQDLRIPRVSGVPHVVRPGDTLDSLAAAFGVSPAAIELFKANGIGGDGALTEGREIFIPGGAPPYPSAILERYTGDQGIAAMTVVAAGVVQETDTNMRAGPGRSYSRVGTLDAGQRLKLLARHDTWVKVDGGLAGAGWVRADLLGLSDATLATLEETNDFPALPPVWIWPTRGAITSPFGWRSSPYRSFHDGLDIANAAWTKIYAARAGRVIEAGWCRGFGYCVKIDHGQGVETIYGHMIKKPPVSAGESVEVGDLIGYMGSTYDSSGGGYSTGVHLHFTVKINGKAVNPLQFLP